MYDRLPNVSAIVKRRAELVMTGKELASTAGIAYSTLKYVHAGRPCTDLTIGKIARALGCSIDDITVPKADGVAA